MSIEARSHNNVIVVAKDDAIIVVITPLQLIIKLIIIVVRVNYSSINSQISLSRLYFSYLQYYRKINATIQSRNKINRGSPI